MSFFFPLPFFYLLHLQDKKPIAVDPDLQEQEGFVMSEQD